MRMSTRGRNNAIKKSPQNGMLFGGSTPLQYAIRSVRRGRNRLSTKNHADRYPMVKGFRGWGQPDVLLEQLETSKPYKIHGAWIQTSNPIGGQAGDPKRHLAAMKDLDFIVVVDTIQT